MPRASRQSSRPVAGARRRWRRVLAVLIGLVVGACVIEAALRLFAPYHFKDDWVLATLPGRYRFRNAQSDVLVEINRFGLRGPEIRLEKPHDVLRVLVIGDSATWGEGVQFAETFPEFARQALTETDPRGRTFEVINLSRPGAGVLEYAKFWNVVGRKFEPDVVVIGFFMGNDPFSVEHPYRIEEMGPAAAKRSTSDDFARRLMSAVSYRLSAARMLLPWEQKPTDIYELWMGPDARGERNPMWEDHLLAQGRAEGVSGDEVRRRLAAIPEGLRLQAMDLQVDPWLVSSAVLHPQSIRDSQEMSRESILRSWQASLGVLDEITASVRRTGATPVVLAIPRAIQVSPHYVPGFRTLGFDLTDEVARGTAPQEHLAYHLTRAGVVLVDPLSELVERERSGNERLYFQYDVHLTPTGNRVLGVVLARALLEEVLR